MIFTVLILYYQIGIKMDRKSFLKKGLFGTGMFAASAVLGNVLVNQNDEIEKPEVLGFNHIPIPILKF